MNEEKVYTVKAVMRVSATFEAGSLEEARARFEEDEELHGDLMRHGQFKIVGVEDEEGNDVTPAVEITGILEESVVSFESFSCCSDEDEDGPHFYVEHESGEIQCFFRFNPDLDGDQAHAKIEADNYCQKLISWANEGKSKCAAIESDSGVRLEIPWKDEYEALEGKRVQVVRVDGELQVKEGGD
ncbi:MAG: hypothetical protein KKB70_12300 [Proteobacteria bacterium]|nr:hypothetical protein [Pseudomonadota bacterium]